MKKLVARASVTTASLKTSILDTAGGISGVAGVVGGGGGGVSLDKNSPPSLIALAAALEEAGDLADADVVLYKDASSYLRKEVSAAEEALKVSSKATKAAVENAKGSFDGNVPVLQCWQDMLTSIDTYNQKQAEVLSATHNEMKDATKELEQTRKAVKGDRDKLVKSLKEAYQAEYKAQSTSGDPKLQEKAESHRKKMQAAEKDANDAVAAVNKTVERVYGQELPALLQRYRDLATQAAELLHTIFHGYCAYLMNSLPTLENKLGIVSRSLTTEFKEAMVKQMDSLTQGDSYDTPSALSNPDPDAPPSVGTSSFSLGGGASSSGADAESDDKSANDDEKPSAAGAGPAEPVPPRPAMAPRPSLTTTDPAPAATSPDAGGVPAPAPRPRPAQRPTVSGPLNPVPLGGALPSGPAPVPAPAQAPGPPALSTGPPPVAPKLAPKPQPAPPVAPAVVQPPAPAKTTGGPPPVSDKPTNVTSGGPPPVSDKPTNMTAAGPPPVSAKPARPPPVVGKKPGERKAQALYDCDSTDPDELSFKSGDVFVIVEDKGADWYQMRDAAGHVGLVPANYVKVL